MLFRSPHDERADETDHPADNSCRTHAPIIGKPPVSSRLGLKPQDDGDNPEDYPAAQEADHPYEKMSRASNPYGDGNACGQIVDILRSI